jgi:hypothetical protein
MYQDCANYTQAYIRDLENKLRIYSDKDDTHIEVVIELRKELAKLKETEANSNRYISELETRLSKSDDINSGLSRKVETLEKEITVREGLYRDLEARVALLDTTSENKVLLNELDTRDKRVAELEKLLEQAVQGRDVADEEQTKMKTKVEAGQVVQMGLLQQISMLQAPRISRAPTPGDAFYTPAEEMAQPSLVSPSPASSRSELTPPDTPDTQRGMVLDLTKSDELTALRAAHQQTMSELEDISLRYRDARTEITELNTQLAEAKLVQSELHDSVPGSAVDFNGDDLSENGSTLQMPVGQSPSSSPVRRRPGAMRRESMPIISPGSGFMAVQKGKDFRGGRGSTTTESKRDR